MSKARIIFVCSNCGANSSKWIGHCPSCGTWNSYQEEILEKREESEPGWKTIKEDHKNLKSVRLDQLETGKLLRLDTHDKELNRALGGGLVRGSVTLLAGQPGIGKSTLLLQLALQIRLQAVLYVSGEESEEQIKIRANRLNHSQESCFLFSETRIDVILSETARLKPGLLIVDSIQTLSSPQLDSAPGTISQIRECTNELIRFAKETGVPVFLIGHITKEGDIAGPKLLEHMVDTVLQFEGDKQYSFRILRTLKNRFGSTDELSIYEMDGTGLKPVENPSELLLSQHEERLSGSAVACTIEGLRPILIETQALVGTAVYGTPQRVATGFDSRRLSMLLAVLEKRCGFHFGNQDVFINLAGGIRINDPAIDLSVVASLISSLEDQALHRQICFAGEVGLSGEIRAVSRVDTRIQEAERLGFKAICISKYNGKIDMARNTKIKVVLLSTVNELYEKVFSGG
ncbi:MAG: DNA repair protein RadA [Saprospiraceae bacterium]|nr:DNA repair protein RadA [Candidatus Vicinibacter affinis]